METNIVFGVIYAVAGIWIYVSMKRNAKKERAAEAVKAAELEAWHEANPGYRWATLAASSATRKPSGDGQDWARQGSPSFDSSCDSSSC